jgi:hypothetical protein
MAVDCPLCEREFATALNLATHIRGHHGLTAAEARIAAGVEPLARPVTGVYLITNPLDGAEYVGQARDIKRRFVDHRKALEDATHGNLLLQLAHERCNVAGLELTFEILEECDAGNLDDREHHWIEKRNTLVSGYNLARVGRRGRSRYFRVEELARAGAELGALWLAIPQETYAECSERRFDFYTSHCRELRAAAVAVAAEMDLDYMCVVKNLLAQNWMGQTYAAWPDRWFFDWLYEPALHPLEPFPEG